jgi:glutathione S-transferase
MIELWGRPSAYNVQKVMWTLGELGINFIQKDIGSNSGELESAQFKKLNPHSRIPVLVDSEAVIWESNTIIRYLFAEYGAKDSAPVSPIQQSHIERWMDWELAKLQPDFIGLFWCFYRTPEADWDSTKIEYHRELCASHLRLLDQQLKTQAYLEGEVFSMADICCATSLYRYFEMGIDVEKPKNLMHWYDRMAIRADYRDNIMVSFTELKGRLEF